jgi:hypothetical protein
MPWTKPLHNKGCVDAAGNGLNHPESGEWEDAVEVVSNWRSCHGYPLQALKMTLRNRALAIDRRALIAQRLKRMSSISAKLKRFENMKLSQMQDLGGCRAVVSSAKRLNKLVEVYAQSVTKNPNERAEFVKKYDYITCPKPDGYRSIHLVYKYRSRAHKHRIYNGLRIEIQLRSKMQHAWATAVETVDSCTGQALKSNLGNPSWKRFFALMGSVIALRERCPSIPDTPTEKAVLIEELRKLATQLNVFGILDGLRVGMDLTSKIRKSHTYLLILDTQKKFTRVIGFPGDQLQTATDEYIKVEKQNVSNPAIQAVLVSVDSVAGLRNAYPNFYLDTRTFLRIVRETIEG